MPPLLPVYTTDLDGLVESGRLFTDTIYPFFKYVIYHLSF